MTELQDPRSLFDVFAASQETFEEAKKKNSEENRKRASYFRIQKDGTFPVRILPLAPVLDQDGKPLPMERKGYEYPLRSLMLKIEDTSKTEKGKPKITYVTVCNAKHVFGEKLKSDLIETFLKTACELYADDEKLCEKLNSGSFNGGLKWDARRCMYVIDLNNPDEGIQIFQLSYSQYKDLEERKLNLWNKLLKNGKKVPCPISSINNAYPVEITRKTENTKASYSFNIDTVSGTNTLDEATLSQLIDTPRLPEALYRYTRYHLEATETFLRQIEEKYDIDVLSSEAVQECIEQIKMLLPADDNSHFTLGGKESVNKPTSPEEALNALYDQLDKLDEAGIDDRSDEGQELRASIKEFIDTYDLDVKIARTKTNADLLDEIDELMNPNDDKKPESEPKKASKVAEDEEDDEPSEPESEPEEDSDDEPAEAPAPRRRERNDDTNEPAARVSRRGARPDRRR